MTRWRCLDGPALGGPRGTRRRGLGGGSNARSQTGERGGLRRFRIDPAPPLSGEAARHTPWTVAGGSCADLVNGVLATKHRAREVRADTALAGTSLVTENRSPSARAGWRPRLGPPASPPPPPPPQGERVGARGHPPASARAPARIAPPKAGGANAMDTPMDEAALAPKTTPARRSRATSPAAGAARSRWRVPSSSTASASPLPSRSPCSCHWRQPCSSSSARCAPRSIYGLRSW